LTQSGLSACTLIITPMMWFITLYIDAMTPQVYWSHSVLHYYSVAWNLINKILNICYKLAYLSRILTSFLSIQFVNLCY
jgi:hypothetical protein